MCAKWLWVCIIVCRYKCFTSDKSANEVFCHFTFLNQVSLESELRSRYCFIHHQLADFCWWLEIFITATEGRKTNLHGCMLSAIENFCRESLHHIFKTSQGFLTRFLGNEGWHFGCSSLPVHHIISMLCISILTVNGFSQLLTCHELSEFYFFLFSIRIGSKDGNFHLCCLLISSRICQMHMCIFLHWSGNKFTACVEFSKVKSDFMICHEIIMFVSRMAHEGRISVRVKFYCFTHCLEDAICANAAGYILMCLWQEMQKKSRK